MKYKVVQMTLDIHDKLVEFWRNTPGIWVSDDDGYESMKTYLKRNPDSNFVAVQGGEIIGTCKCSHDGRRGYLHHVAVKEEFRKQGIAQEMINRCLAYLKKNGINKYRVFVLDSNPEALKFWKHLGFEEQVYDYRTLGKDL